MSTFRPNRWLAAFRPNPNATLRLFCLHHAGGNAAVYARWVHDLPDAVELVAIQLPGRGNRLGEPPLRRVEPLVEALGPAMLTHLNKPYAIFGHSMGALVGFELTRWLRRRSLPSPTALFVSGHRAPHLPHTADPIHHLPHDQLLEELRRYNGTPAELLEHRELMDLMLPTLQADFELTETYRYAPAAPLECPILAFGGTEDEHVSSAELAAWERQTSATCRLHTYRGDHFSYLPMALRDLRAELDLLVSGLQTGRRPWEAGAL